MKKYLAPRFTRGSPPHKGIIPTAVWQPQAKLGDGSLLHHGKPGNHPLPSRPRPK